MLSKEQVAKYRKNGFIVPNYKLPIEAIESLRQEIDKLIGNDPEFQQFVPTVLDYDRQFLKYAEDPKILNIIEQLAGPDFVLWNISLFGKPALNGKKVPWHQDGEYWPIRPMATTRVWISLDHSTRDNGCLMYLRGSHRNKQIFTHHEATDRSMLLHYGIDPNKINEKDIFYLELEPGGMGIHDIFMVHGSAPNLTSLPRRALVLNFMPTTSYFDHKLAAKQFAEMDINFDHSRRPLFLMRGIDQCKKNNLEIGHS